MVEGRSVIGSIALHLGAHKTATTYIQECLRQNITSLEKSSVCYIPLEKLRPSLTRSVIKGHFLRTHKRKYRKLLKTNRRLIISDENLIGGAKDLYKSGVLYPNLNKRLKRLRQQLPVANIEVYFCVRSYETYLPAMYCEYIRHNDFINFDEYLSSVDIDKISWVSVLDALASIYGRESLRVWRFDEFSSLEQAVFQSIGDNDIELNKQVDNVRPSPSARAISALEEASKEMRGDELSKLQKELEQTYPKGKKYPKYDPFSDIEKQQLSSRFEFECKLLKNKYTFF